MSNDPESSSSEAESSFEESTTLSESENRRSGSTSFWAELKRRKVMRVAITYGVVAWLLIQVTSIIFPQFDIPDWAARLVTLVPLIGFPVAVIITWAFELTPEGIKTTKLLDADQAERTVSENKFNSAIGWLPD